ncbi:hypothetical protein BDA99DRAFT_505905 [Phascolomyces articulosus]|uniref:Uncharacterized protein n=1 Tax=Phascolomyces articulosus TaxID=60185 RepID=A0AAD5K2R7_9FUNG|nr:hypothetical protein BDA99DRAFT_505905 [Phascolomyces articulosus]
MDETQELGKRAQKLDVLNARFTKSVLDSFSWEEYEKCCGPFADRYKHQLEASYIQILGFLKENLWKEFDKIKEEANLVERLNKLEDIIRQAKEDPSNAPLNTVPQPDQTFRSLRVKLKFEALAKLREEETKLRAENEELMKEIANKSENFEKKKANVDIALREYQEAANVTESIPMEALEQVIDQIL